MLSWIAHYKNKYPGGRVQATDSCIDVFDAQGEHVVALRKGGDGMWHCTSEAHGLRDRHCLAPIPKASRVHKVHHGKHVGHDEEHEERRNALGQFCDSNGRVKSCAELKKEGWNFDDKGRVEGSAPAKNQASSEAPDKKSVAAKVAAGARLG